MRPRRRRGHIVAFLLFMLFLLWMLMSVQQDPDLYALQQSIADMCYDYERNFVSGNMCSSLCGGKISIDGCLSCQSQHKGGPHVSCDREIFFGQLHVGPDLTKSVLVKLADSPNKTRRRHRDTDVRWTFESLYKNMSSILRVMFGERRHYDSLIYSLLSLADSNKDGHLSPAEASTIHSLATNREFITTVAMVTSSKVPKLLGFCGDVYVTRGLHSYSLPDESSWVQVLPPWATRVNIAVTILEFVEEIQDVVLGDLLLCRLSLQDIGLLEEDEAGFYNFEWVVTEKQIVEQLGSHPCATHNDCMYGPNCHPQCGQDGFCAIKKNHTNLPGVCRLIKSFLDKGAPQDFGSKFKVLWERCLGLDTHRADLHLEHSLILSDLKNSLWSEIQLSYGKPKRVARRKQFIKTSDNK